MVRFDMFEEIKTTEIYVIRKTDFPAEFALPIKLLAWLDGCAMTEGRTPAELVETALWRYLREVHCPSGFADAMAPRPSEASNDA